jgi:GT2 family glycosyltransferase
MNSQITIVLISHNSSDLVLKFINNLSKNFKILVIENSSNLELKDKIRNYKNVKIEYMNNNGYGAAINHARKFIKTKYFFVFSPDIKNVDDNLIRVFDKKVKTIRNFGAFGPRFLNVKEKSHKQSNINEEIGIINSISGSAMFFDLSIFDKLGGFDENIFLYFEETDYCMRANKKGFKIYQINNVLVEHPKGPSEGAVKIKKKSEIRNLRNLYSWHFVWSKYYLHTKHYGKIFALIYFIPSLVRIIFRINLYKYKKDKDKKDKFKARLNGLISSVKGLKSSKRL